MNKVRIRKYSGSYFPGFRLNTERYSISLRIQAEYGKIQTRITPNTDSFYAMFKTKDNVNGSFNSDELNKPKVLFLS